MKRFISFILVFTILAVGIFTACEKKSETPDMTTGHLQSDNNKSSNSTSKDNGEQNNAADNKDSSTFPLTIKDAHGTEMTIEKKPQKIVSLSLESDEILFSLVDIDRIAAITHLADDEGISNIADKAIEIPVKISQSDTEKIIALSPDLVIVPSWLSMSSIEQLRDAKITVYAMGTANNIDQLKESIPQIALLVGEQQKGNELLDWIDDKVKAVNDKVGSLKEEDKKTVLVCDGFWNTYAKGTTSDDIVSRAGLINVATRAGLEFWPQVSKENIIEWNPDIIFLPTWSYDDKFDPEDFRKKFMEDESLKDVSAIKNNRVYLMKDKHMTSTSQYMVLGLEDAAKAAYPELFE